MTASDAMAASLSADLLSGWVIKWATLPHARGVRGEP